MRSPRSLTFSALFTRDHIHLSQRCAADHTKRCRHQPPPGQFVLRIIHYHYQGSQHAANLLPHVGECKCVFRFVCREIRGGLATLSAATATQASFGRLTLDVLANLSCPSSAASGRSRDLIYNLFPGSALFMAF